MKLNIKQKILFESGTPENVLLNILLYFKVKFKVFISLAVQSQDIAYIVCVCRTITVLQNYSQMICYISYNVIKDVPHIYDYQ